MAIVDASEETERVKVNCILENNLQHALTSAQLGDLKGKSKDTSSISNTLDPLPQKLENDNVKFEFQVSEQKDTTRKTSANTKFAKQSILEKPPSSSRPKMYAVTPLPKSMAFPTVGETNALSNQVTSNLAPSSQESNDMKNDNVLSPGIFSVINMPEQMLVGEFLPPYYISQLEDSIIISGNFNFGDCAWELEVDDGEVSSYRQLFTIPYQAEHKLKLLGFSKDKQPIVEVAIFQQWHQSL
nr:hypothetical protein [Tanacetum cinerariifolium]